MQFLVALRMFDSELLGCVEAISILCFIYLLEGKMSCLVMILQKATKIKQTYGGL